MWWRGIFAVFLWLCLMASGQALALEGAPHPGLSLAYQLDPPQPRDAESAYRDWQQGRFTTTPQASLALGLAKPPVWVATQLDNPTDQPLQRYLLLDTSWLDQVSFYLYHQGEQRQVWHTGDTFPFADRTPLLSGFVLPLELPPGSSELLIYVATPDPLVVPLHLLSEAELQRFAQQRLLSYGFSWGYLLALLFYNAALFVGIRDRRYLLYALYLGVFTLANLSYTGHAFAWLWPDAPGWQQWAQPLLISALGCSGLIFANAFLDTRRHCTRAFRLSQLGMLLVVLLQTIALILDLQALALVSAFSFMLVFTLLMLGMGLYRLHQGSFSARFFLSALAFGTLGILITTLATWGWLPYNGWTFRAAEAGMLIEATLLALALAARIRRVEQRQKQAEAAANTDTLTQLNNRRALAEQAARLWEVSQRRHMPLSALVLDIDHFKQCNDTWGHAFGDQVLQHLGRCIQDNIREQDVAARWGGEEFVILLPATDLHQAELFAQRLLHLVRRTPLQCDDSTVQITASLGVAQREEDDMCWEDLIQRADKALYRAKASGRNRVCSSTQQA